MFATAAVALSECGSIASYGGSCLPDACTIEQNDAGKDAATVPFYGGACPGNSCPDASDASDDVSDASADASADAADESD
jgi:hypothetical protein